MRYFLTRNKISLSRQLANIITMLRLFLALPLIYSFYRDNLSLAFILIIVGAFSDILDGYFARKAGGGSQWGAKLDPLADKILIFIPIIWLTESGIIPFWATWLLFSRELIISTWRAQQISGGPASLFGKSKTVLQFTSILLMIWPSTLGGYYYSNILLYSYYFLCHISDIIGKITILPLGL